MFDFEQRAERLIAEAVARGELQGLPGEGRRLNLDDDGLIPAEMRLAHRILKNAGFVPEGVAVRAEIAGLEDERRGAARDTDRARAAKRLVLLRMMLEARDKRCGTFCLADDYRNRVLDRLGGGSR